VPTVHQPEAASARSLTDQAYYRIRELIVRLELAPGAFVNERDLMERVGLGRTPVREALRTLARDKLVEVMPRRGVFIAPINVGDLAGLSEVRLALEPYAARLAAERRTPADRDAAVALLQALDEAGDDEHLLIGLDQRIHRHIWACAHSPFLVRTLEEYYILALRIWFLALDRVAELADAVHEHRELLETIRDGDAARAETSMRRHVTAFEQAIRTVL
jgi:DNA-binding GntR family transcriptional regulator